MIDQLQDIRAVETNSAGLFAMGDEKVPLEKAHFGLDSKVISRISSDLGVDYQGVEVELEKFYSEKLGEIRELMNRLGIPDNHQDEVRLAFVSRIEEFRDHALADSLPEKPLRDYLPREEDIIAYLKSPDGVGPWTEVNALNKPLLRELAPKAYKALVHWEKKPDNSLASKGLSIPSKTELVAATKIPSDILKAAQRIVRRADRAKAARAKLDIEP